MIIKCNCGNVIGEGIIVRKGNRKAFEYTNLYPKIKGTMIRNNSNDPNKWTWICSNCQRFAHVKK